MKTLKRFLFFLAGICLLIACSKSDDFLGNGSFGNSFKNGQNEPIVDLKYSPGTVFNLEGVAGYNTWEVISGKVWQDVANPCIGTLEFLEGRNFRYTFTETRPNGNAAVFTGKISASGTLTFQFPSPLFVDPVNGPFYITDVIKGHACAEIWGEGINQGTLVFKGNFDGTRFTAIAKFMAKVASPCPSNDMFDPALVNGPLHWTFSYNLCVVED
jgi:hypothetical protein